MNTEIPASRAGRTVAETRDLAFHFRGDGWEYFRIWIVNVFLTILTLGIYSAWAKVRNRQYFYGNTLLDDASFRYTADPVAILIGRLIAVGVLGIYFAMRELVPTLALVMMGLMVLAMPAVIVRSMAFNLRNSVYRNVPFRFQRNYRQAYGVFLAPFAVLLLLAAVGGAIGREVSGPGEGQAAAAAAVGLAALAYVVGLPFFNYLATVFYVKNSHYGDSGFSYEGGAGGFYALYGKTALVGIGAMFLAVLLAALGGGGAAFLMANSQAADPTPETGRTLAMVLSQGLSMLLVLPAYVLIYAYFQAKRFNLTYNNSTLADAYGFRANLRTGGMAWLYLSNTLLIAVTLGLAIPWAKVRTARYRLENTTFLATEDLNRFAAGEKEKVNALGDELGEVFDLEIGL